MQRRSKPVKPARTKPGPGATLRTRRVAATHTTAGAAPYFSTQRLGQYALRHAQVLLSTLGRLYRNPLTSLMTAAVIGIALALPTGLFVALANVQQLSGGFDSAARITLFLRATVDDSQAAGIAKQLSAQKDIAKASAVTRAQALAEFRQLSGFGAALDALDENPLPAVIVVQPANADANTPETVQALLERLRLMPQVELAQLDMQWVKRLYAFLALGQRGILLIAALLGLSVLLIVGNTIRLDIQNHREEIEVIKLIGATDAFVRRPFLYSGFWYGLGGGLIAWLLVNGALALLRGPVRQLAGLYGSGFSLSALGAGTSLALLALSTALGLLGSWLAVGRHLDAIQPS